MVAERRKHNGETRRRRTVIAAATNRTQHFAASDVAARRISSHTETRPKPSSSIPASPTSEVTIAIAPTRATLRNTRPPSPNISYANINTSVTTGYPIINTGYAHANSSAAALRSRRNLCRRRNTGKEARPLPRSCRPVITGLAQRRTYGGAHRRFRHRHGIRRQISVGKPGIHSRRPHHVAVSPLPSCRPVVAGNARSAASGHQSCLSR